ncbi:hypothetical protein HGRIS_005484 [Hohenbuehelia grisea]|uniref:T6SS Phospholipase effector Tle1-like catalytic domain-containing protein n=1 Tax=Hohenbuehelia grisea TaxID=104357 RepID=A0ABR3JY36_9AGAR
MPSPLNDPVGPPNPAAASMPPESSTDSGSSPLNPTLLARDLSSPVIPMAQLPPFSGSSLALGSPTPLYNARFLGAVPRDPSSKDIIVEIEPHPAPSPAIPTTSVAGDDETRPVLNTKAADNRTFAKNCSHSAEKPGKRNLVVCIDGTANQFSVKNTNIVELYSNLVKDGEQLTYYNSGIGTYAKPAYMSLSYIIQRIDHTIDMMIAWNFKRIVLSAYQWLSENYRDGDRIFLFGFSRGAYQVRVIAGMIQLVGLLHKGNNDQIAL